MYRLIVHATKTKDRGYSLKHTVKTAGIAGLGAALAAGLAGSAAAQVLPPNPDLTCVVPPAEFNSWFDSGHPGLNQPVKEANSITFSPSNNCNFYKWSEQMFLWLTSPASPPYQGNRVLDSQIFYQLDNNNLVAQIPFGPLNLALRAAQVGPDGLPVILDSKGHLREFVTAPSQAGVTALSTVGGEGPAAIANVGTSEDGKALFLDAEGKTVAFTPKVTEAMLPETLGRLAQLAPPREGEAALSATDSRQQIANALTAKNILIQFNTDNGPIFVEAGTDAIDNLGPGQAGGNGVLISQQQKPQQQSVIFYETIVNDVYAWYLTGRKTTGGIPPLYAGSNPATYGLFPTTSTDLQAIVNFSKAHGGPSSFPDGNALAIEAKLSWVDASTLPSGAQGYITAEANVPVYNTSNSTNWAPSGTKLTTVALVGVHVVGGVQNHPEMVWATFEHQANTPLATYQYTSGGKPVTVQKNTFGTWLFSANNAPAPYNDELAMLCPNKQQQCTSIPAGHIVSATSAAIGPSNILREKSWGVASNGIPNQEDATPAAANTEIISIDTNVRSQLSAAGATADPRFNYLLIGSTWTFGGGEPSGSYPTNPKPDGSGADEIGTSMLANSSMETFQQGPDTTFSTGTNCFSCHKSSGKNPKVKANTLVSHIFGSINPLK
jgi:hypothetical protein